MKQSGAMVIECAWMEREHNMKLIYKLQLSFGILLVGILVLTAVFLYPLLLNTLVDNQRKELIAQGTAMMELVETLPTQDISANQVTAATLTLPAINAKGKIDAILIEPNKNILFSTMTDSQSAEWLPLIEQNINNKQPGLWEGKEDKYIVETFTSSPQELNPTINLTPATLVMSTPLSEVKSFQAELFTRMMIILAIGGILAFILSVFITKRLVTPLEKLKLELKKVEKRHFDEVQLIQTGGEIGEVAQSVYHLAGELNQHQLAQKQFFQNASHELKTPLMTIQGYAEGIRDGIFTGDKADKGLDVITNECERLKKIVTEMILLAKLESEDGIFHTKAVFVKQLIAQAVERMQPLTMNKEVEIEVRYEVDDPASLVINGDPEKLLQALLNIMGNAIRHASQIIRIQISVDDDHVKIQVIDDGEGIADQLLPQLFQRFIKGKNGETGLGLAISRAIIERCKGQITAYNDANHGAVFSMRFPLI